MKAFAAALLITLSCSPVILAQGEGVFPDDFFGIYTGELEISSKKGHQTINMEFHLQPTDSIGRYEYKLVYILGGDRQERDYTLVEQNKATGEYIVDENNGIILDDKVVGNRMYALFEVNGSLLTTFITFASDHMVFEIVATNIEDKRITFPDEDPATKVISYPVSTVQRAVLQKQ
jgi:hypothetical protein